MTSKQINEAWNELPPYKERTPMQHHLSKVLRCREMINSIMVYGNINSPYDEETDTFDRYLAKYVESNDKYYHLGKKRVLELIREQQADFAKAVVKSGVYTDHEGCTYNSCVWADEM